MRIKEKVIIYGAGERGCGIYDFFISKGLDSCIEGFCDRNYLNLKNVKDKKVYGYEEVKSMKLPCIISMVDKEAVREVKGMLEEDGIFQYTLDDLADILGKDRVIFNREFCAFFHIHGMDSYFESAEEKGAMDIFWNKESEFYKLFKKLDISNVIELACGRGRHVPQYVEKVDNIVLVDILKENIEFCKKRFKNQQNIYYYCNNGYNLHKLESSSYSSVFSYDAMVHFEMLDIYEYLKDIYRVLIPGGCALIHHSNNDMDYKASFINAPEGRSFMNKDIFAYLAHRVGFVVVEQKIIDWELKNLDCITLIQKQ